ncbi:MAG: hypothetical protein JNK82_13565 [Myxococcaceae bacterium]|nr:hypothetical protein [Myxococcaceae bacterium]
MNSGCVPDYQSLPEGYPANPADPTGTAGQIDPTTGQPFVRPPVVDERQQFHEAVQTVKANFDKLDGFSMFGIGADFDVNTLYKAASDPSNPQLQKAAKFLLANSEMLNELDTAKHGGGADGTISLGDVDAKLSSLDREMQIRELATDPRLKDLTTHLGTINQYWDVLDTANSPFKFFRDGKVSLDDLNKLAIDANAPPELRDAAYFFSRHPDLRGMLDVAKEGGSTDNLISREDLTTFQTQFQNMLDSMPKYDRIPGVGARY